MRRLSARRLSRQKKVKKTRQLALFPQNLYFLLLPLLTFLGGYILITSVTKGQLKQDQIACCVPDLSHDGEFVPGEKLAYFEGEKLPAPSSLPTFLANENVKRQVLGEASGGERWIEVNLSEQKLIAHDGSTIFLETPVSTGKTWTPTPTGEFWIWYKTKAQKMSGGEGASYYYLPNVPYIMFFQSSQVSGAKGFSLHGTYWHNNFGHQMSHGCVNLPTPIAERLYYWTTPVVPEGKNIARADADQGTRIMIHD